MGDARKISELVEVTTLGLNDELVLVHYGDGSLGPSGPVGPTATPTPFAPSYLDNSIPTAVCLEGASESSYDNLILDGSYTRAYEYNSKPLYQNAFSSDQLKSMIWWRDDGWWLISYSIWSDYDNAWADWDIAYYSPMDLASPHQVSGWLAWDSGWTLNPSVEPGMCANQISEKSYSIQGNAYVNGYDGTHLFFRIEGIGDESTKNDTINVDDLVYLENIEFNYEDCWVGDHVSFTEAHYRVGTVHENVHPETGEKTWDLECPHGKDVSSNCGGTYVTNTGKLTVFFNVNGGPGPDPIRMKDTIL